MGCFLSADAKISHSIDRKNKKDFSKEKRTIKLLLLGAGESGKSTILKQLTNIYGVPPSLQELRSLTPVVLRNTITSLKILLDQATKFGHYEEVIDKAAFKRISLLDDHQGLSPEIGSDIKTLWNDPSILKTWERRSEFQILDSSKYFFDAIERITSSDYTATPTDLLYTRVRTTGVVIEKLVIDGHPFHIYDVGGQRNERKKWIHCFDDATCIIYVAALNEYDQNLFENAKVNRMMESIELFETVVNNPVLQKSALILFLNKSDLFQEKIKKVSIKSIQHFRDYSGALGSAQPGIEYFVSRFLSVNLQKNRCIYHHVTCATDESNVKIVFVACMDTILKGNLQDAGYID